MVFAISEMSESLYHKNLVQHLRDEIHKRHGLKGGFTILSDLDNHSGDPPPRNLRGNVPDVYAKVLATGEEIIGEAKTANDFETNRSISQVENFLDYLQKSNTGKFYLCVPWHIEIHAEIIINKMALSKNISLDRVGILAPI